jgi:hypothetical protein
MGEVAAGTCRHWGHVNTYIRHRSTDTGSQRNNSKVQHVNSLVPRFRVRNPLAWSFALVAAGSIRRPGRVRVSRRSRPCSGWRTREPVRQILQRPMVIADSKFDRPRTPSTPARSEVPGWPWTSGASGRRFLGSARNGGGGKSGRNEAFLQPGFSGYRRFGLPWEER